MILQQEIKYEVLNEKELHQLFIRYKEGNHIAREKLILHNLKLVIYIAKRFTNTECDIDELVDTGTIGLIKAIDSFNLEKGFKFTTYSARCIENEILLYLRHGKKKMMDVSISTVLNENVEGDTFTYEDILMDSNPIAEDNIVTDCEKLLLRKLVEELPEKEKEIIKLHFGFYNDIVYQQKEIADKFGITQSYVSRIIRSTVQKLKQKYIRHI